MFVKPTTSVGNFGNRQFIPSAYVDGGELNLQVNLNPLVAIPIADWTKVGPTEIIITLGPANTTQETFDVLGFITEFKIDGPLDGKPVTANIKVKITDEVNNSFTSDGAVTWTAAA